MDVRGGGQPARRVARRRARGTRARRKRPRAMGSPRPSRPAHPPGGADGATDARLPDPARADVRHSRERRHLQPRRVAERHGQAAARARRRRLRRRPRAGADRAAARAARLLLAGRAGRRHLPRLFDERRHQQPRQPGRGPAQAQPAPRPHRRLRGGRVDRAPVVRRRVHRDPERRRPRRPSERAEAAIRGAPGAVRRPSRGAQGTPRAAAGLRGARRARPRPPHRDRRRCRGALALPAGPGRQPLHRPARAGLR